MKMAADKKEHCVKCDDCRNPANGKYYYPFFGGYWVVQCNECAKGYQAFEPLTGSHAVELFNTKLTN